MTLYCVKCSEPWTFDSLHTEAAQRCHERGIEPAGGLYMRVFNEVCRDFRARGCEALAASHGPGGATEAAAAIYEMSGTDMDGAASDLEYFRSLVTT